MPRSHDSTVKICFVGGPGTGKSTLAHAVNVALKMRGVDCEHIPEYARTYIRQSGTPSHYLEQFPIIIGAMRREEEIEVHDMMIVDSASFIMMVYLTHYAPKGLSQDEQAKWEYHFNVMQGLARERLIWFDHIFYVPAGLFPVPLQDPSRFNPHDSVDVSAAIQTYLDANGVNYYTVAQTALQGRIDEVVAYLQETGALESSKES